MCDIWYLDEDDQIPAENAHKDVVRTFEIDENEFKPRQSQIIKYITTNLNTKMKKMMKKMKKMKR